MSASSSGRPSWRTGASRPDSPRRLRDTHARSRPWFSRRLLFRASESSRRWRNGSRSRLLWSMRRLSASSSARTALALAAASADFCSSSVPARRRRRRRRGKRERGSGARGEPRRREPPAGAGGAGWGRSGGSFERVHVRRNANSLAVVPPCTTRHKPRVVAPERCRASRHRCRRQQVSSQRQSDDTTQVNPCCAARPTSERALLTTHSARRSASTNRAAGPWPVRQCLGTGHQQQPGDAAPAPARQVAPRPARGDAAVDVDALHPRAAAASAQASHATARGDR